MIQHFPSKLQEWPYLGYEFTYDVFWYAGIQGLCTVHRQLTCTDRASEGNILVLV